MAGNPYMHVYLEYPPAEPPGSRPARESLYFVPPYTREIVRVLALFDGVQQPQN